MSLAKDKSANRLQTQLGLNRIESLELLRGLLDIMKDTLTQGEDLLISGFGKFSVRQTRRDGAGTLRPIKTLSWDPAKY